MTEPQALRLAITDFYSSPPPRSEPLITCLERRGAQLSNQLRNSDIVLASVFGRRHRAANGNVLMFSGETRFNDEHARFTIDCRSMGRSNHFRLPFWAYVAMMDDDLQPPLDTDRRPKFCNFIFSNRRCATRNSFFEMLDARHPVDALGAVHNNAFDSRLDAGSSNGWRETKLNVLRDYRFTIAFENSEMPGYTTEKLIDAWLAGSVPIYWGNPMFTADFPPNSCLNLYEAGSFSRLVDQVLEAEHDPARYAELQNANPFRTGLAAEVLAQYRQGLEEFVDHVLEESRRSPRWAKEHRPERRRARRGALLRYFLRR